MKFYYVRGNFQAKTAHSTLFRGIFIMLFGFMVAAGAQAAGSSVPPTVAVSVLPQAEFVARIAGDKVKVLTLVRPGADPHNYEPTPRQMAELSGAAIWFSIGVEFENAILPKVKALYPTLNVVNTAKDVVYRSLETHADLTAPAASSPSQPALAASQHADEGGGPDPHVWLGLAAVKVQLASIRDALIALLPADAALFKANHDAYLKEIEAVFAGLAKRLAPLKGDEVFVYHPSFGYFLDNFGLKQVAVEVGGKEPTQKTIALLIEKARKAGAKIIFVQKQFSVTAARTVAQAIGGAVVEIDPLAPDWLENIKVMGAALQRAAVR
ncbi:MAG: zinc ABC transporter substrate-binding protein [Spirochaetales bacterium]|jgi:zinc transport system substrate-binding protein